MFGQVQRLEVENLRSIRHVEVSLGAVNLVTGANGSGKSNLFNAFRLIRAAVEGRLAAAVAEQGGSCESTQPRVDQTHSDIPARAMVKRVGCDPIRLVNAFKRENPEFGQHRKGAPQPQCWVHSDKSTRGRIIWDKQYLLYATLTDSTYLLLASLYRPMIWALRNRPFDGATSRAL